MTPDYYVRYLPFPARVGAVVVPNDDGSFDIYISSRLSDEAQRERLEHELVHIRRDHFYQPIPVALAEREAGGMVTPAPPTTPPTSAPPCLPLSEEVSAQAEVGVVPTPTPAASTDRWLLSWQQAMAWAEEMMQRQGWPDKPTQK